VLFGLLGVLAFVLAAPVEVLAARSQSRLAALIMVYQLSLSHKGGGLNPLPGARGAAVTRARGNISRQAGAAVRCSAGTRASTRAQDAHSGDSHGVARPPGEPSVCG